MHILGLSLKRSVNGLPGQTLNLSKVTKQERLRRVQKVEIPDLETNYLFVKSKIIRTMLNIL